MDENTTPGADTPEPLPGDHESSRNPVPVIATANESGRSLLTTGCIVTLIALAVSAVAGGASGYLGARTALGGRQTDSPAGGTIRVVSGSTDEPVAAAAAAALPSVVNIEVLSAPASSKGSSGLPKNHPDVPSGGTGSGVAFRKAPGGGTYILTNNHVVEGATTIMVTTGDGAALKATLVGRDPETDMAVIRVAKSIPVIGIGDSEKLKVGQLVVAIGSPFGLQHSVSSGVVSAVHRALPDGFDDSTRTVYPLIDVIQSDAAINPGNSGGALVDRRGALQGVISAIYSGSGANAGVGFAIPVNAAVRIAGELITDGRAKHPFLGIEGMSVDAALAKERTLPVTEGAIVERVFKDTGAARAGLEKADIVVGIDGTPIRSMDDLILNVRRHAVGDKVTLEIWRDGAKRTLEMTVGDKPADLK
ncbi:MAG: trypsin-like peptidase domain-containing protein [Coriobacteriia bacterium]|nr:trypsin-like peptidase domain-containing protein [Coriobacteriia bacterium]